MKIIFHLKVKDLNMYKIGVFSTLLGIQKINKIAVAILSCKEVAVNL